MKSARALLLAVAAAGSAGCSSAAYLSQAARGQLGIVRAARPIPEVVAERRVPNRIGRLLLAVDGIKAYARAQGLAPTRSYRSYADLGRPAAVWVVQACAPLAFEERTWSFPVVGSVPYLGFFDEGAARREAAALAREGLDVEVRGAGAYSTLGWFHDPVLSTMIEPGDAALGELANVILHESVHATIYVNDQSTFDESLASFVADRLTLPWLAGAVGPDAPEARAWAAALEADRARRERLHRAYVELDALYRSGVSARQKRAGKARALAAAQEELRLTRPLNNATLAGYRTYGAGAAAFERLLAACGGSWRRMMRALSTLRASDFGRPQRAEFDDVLDRLASGGCADGAAPSGPAP